MIEFFPGGVVPTAHRVEFFLREAAKLEPREEIYLAKAIAGLSPAKLNDLASRILSASQDERLLKLFFKNPGVHRKMDIESLSHHFAVIRVMEGKGAISREIFEEMATSLVAGYASSYGESFLCRLSGIVAVATKGSSSVERFISPDFDLALSRHLASYDVAKQNDRQAMRSWDALKFIELPATLEVYLGSMQAENPDSAAQLVADLVMLDKLPESYIAASRRVLGDELLVQVANSSKQRLSGIRSIAILVPVFGEAVFHSPGFLCELQKQLDVSEIPTYLTNFQSMSFDETRFPILADFLVQKMDLAININTQTKDMSFSVDLAGLASRKGRGLEVLKLNLNAVSDTLDLNAGDSATDKLNMAYRVGSGKTQTISRIMAYSHLRKVVARVGLECLHELSKDVRAGFVMDCIETHGMNLPKKEVMRLFPQIKGAILENDLGL